MHITLKQPGQPVADFSVRGAVIDVAGVVVDTAARQEDIAVMIEIRNNGGTPAEGGDGAYMAQIEIPARRYVEHEIKEEDGSTTASRDAIPLDPNAVEVTLWPAF